MITFDWPNRLIIMDTADWQPIEAFRAMELERSSNEFVRRYKPLADMIGGQPKGGGKQFPNALRLLDGAKIVPLDGSIAPITTIQGEVVTDNPDIDADPFDTSGLILQPRIALQPASEITTVNTGSGVTSQDMDDIADRVWERMIDVAGGLQ